MEQQRKGESIALIPVLLTIVFLAVILTFLASHYSLWGDEFDTIAPAFRDWTGPKSFWWQIKQYNANPPGDNLVVRILYRTRFLNWLYNFSPEVFWRIPSIFAYIGSAFVTYWLSLRWSRSVVLSYTLFFLYVMIPLPFFYGVETRFYSWALFFMTLAVWQTLICIQERVNLRTLGALSAIVGLGVLFHIALALNCYLLFFYGMFVLAQKSLEAVKKHRIKTFFDSAFLLRISACLIPYFIFKYEKHHLIFLPGGKGIGAVAVQSLIQARKEIPAELAQLLPNLGWGVHSWTIELLIALLVLRAGWDLFRRKWRESATGLTLLILLIGGSFILLASANANSYALGLRNYLFEAPILIATIGYVFFEPLRAWASLLDRFGALLIVPLFVISAGAVSARALTHVDNPEGKVSIPLAQFRDFYRILPDKRPLVAVGVGDGDLWSTRDFSGYIGGAHLNYLKEFHPLFLTTRSKAHWRIPRDRQGWRNYDLLIFEPLDERFHAHYPEIPVKALRCFKFPSGPLSFCRFADPFPGN